MRIAEAVERDVPQCNPGESLQEATETMWLWGYESLPVCDVEGKFVGSVSMRGMCLRCHLTGKTLADIQVREAVSHANVFCRPDDAAPAVMNLMCRSRFWHLPVVDDDHKLEGIVHYVDLLHRLTTARETLHVAGADDASLRLDRLSGWTLVLSQRELISPTGERTCLSRAEERLLETFTRNPGQVLSRAALMRQVCNRDWVPSDRYIDVLVAGLRRKFGERASDAQVIRTVQNDGYVFTPRVTGGQIVDQPAGRTAAKGPRRAEARAEAAAAPGAFAGEFNNEPGRPPIQLLRN